MKLAELKKHKMEAMKAREKDRATLLGVLIGEIENEIKKNYEGDTEELAVKDTIKQQHKKALQTLEYDQSIEAQLYVSILESYLPKRLSESDLKYLLEQTNPQSIKDWMAFLKDKHPNQYDGKLASHLFNNS